MINQVIVASYGYRYEVWAKTFIYSTMYNEQLLLAFWMHSLSNNLAKLLAFVESVTCWTLFIGISIFPENSNITTAPVQDLAWLSAMSS